MKKFAFVDSVRGFAIMWVVLVHSFLWIKSGSDFLNTLAWSGRMGVQMFFVASAFTLMYSMNRRKDEKQPILNFFIRRFFRIAPMFYVAIVVYGIFGNSEPSQFAPNGEQWWHIMLTALFLHGFHPESINSIVPGGWSIAVEMVFYALLPIMFSYLKSIKNILFYIAITIGINLIFTAIATNTITPLYIEKHQYIVKIFTTYWIFAQLPVFGFGFLLYNVFTRYKISDYWLGSLIIGFSIFLHISFLGIESYELLLSPDIMYAFVFSLFFLGLYISQSKIFVNFITQWIGKLSFSIYLVHFAVIAALKEVPIEFVQKVMHFHLLTTFLIVLAISSAIAYFTYTFIEMKGILIGKKIIEKLESKA